MVNTSSIAGLVALPTLGIYTASKYAVVGISETLRGELAPFGIGVSVLCPSFVNTRLHESHRNRPAALGPGPEEPNEFMSPDAQHRTRSADHRRTSGSRRETRRLLHPAEPGREARAFRCARTRSSRPATWSERHAPAWRPFRFGVQSFSATSRAAWRDVAKRTEDLGYDVLNLADHFIGPGPAQEATSHPPQELAAVPAMAVAAEATTRLRLGCRVFCVDYRHPVVLAKEAATLDLFSARDGSRSASERAGSPASTKPPAFPSSGPACASRSWRKRSR